MNVTENKTKTFSQVRLEQAINLLVDEGKRIKQISIRCPYCGDSRRNPTSTHLGITFVPSNRTPVPSWHCFRCDESGMVNAKFLNTVGVDNDIIKKYLKYQKKNVYRSEPTVKEVSFNKKSKSIHFVYNTKSRQYEYLKNRFKMEFTEEDINLFKIILDPPAFFRGLSKNKSKKIDHIMMMGDQEVDLSNYIGFLTQDSKQAVFRAIDKETEPRFYNMMIEDTDYRKIYVVGNKIDIKAEKFNFVLTEGIFDIVGVYQHFYKHQTDLSNTIFVAALGKSFEEPINRLIQSGFLNFDIYLFSDSSSDITLEYYEEILKNPYVDKIYLAQNKKEGEKDFGVSLDRIEFDDFILLNSKKIKNMIQDRDDKKKAQ